MGQGAHQPLTPTVVEAAQLAVQLAQRLAPLRGGRGGDQIRQALGRGQVHLAVDEGAPRKLAGLGRAQAGHAAKGADHRRNSGAPAMDVKLGDVLAGEARRPGEPKTQPVIEGLAAVWVTKAGACGVTRLRHGAAEVLQRRRGVGPGDADDRDPGAAGCRGQGEYGSRFHGPVILAKPRPVRGTGVARKASPIPRQRKMP